MASGVNDHGESPSLSPVRQNIQPSVPAAIERGSKWSKRRDPDSINKDRPQKDTKSKRKRNIASPSIPKGKRQRGSQPSPEPMDSSTHSRTLRSTTRAASRAASTTTPAGSSSPQPSGAGRGGLQQRRAQPGGRGAAGLAAADGGLSGGGDGTGQQHGRAGVARAEPLSAAHQVAEEVGGGGGGGAGDHSGGGAVPHPPRQPPQRGPGPGGRLPEPAGAAQISTGTLLVEHLLLIDNDNKYPLPVKIDFPKSFEFKPKNLAQSGLKNEQSNCSHISTLIALNRCNLARLIKGEHMTFPDGSPDFPSMILADVIR